MAGDKKNTREEERKGYERESFVQNGT